MGGLSKAVVFRVYKQPSFPIGKDGRELWSTRVVESGCVARDGRAASADGRAATGFLAGADDRRRNGGVQWKCCRMIHPAQRLDS